MLKSALYSFCVYLLSFSVLAADNYDEILMIYDTQGATAAIPALEALAKTGDVEAQYQLGQRYLLGEDMPQDLPQALHYLQAAAAEAHIAAMKTLGDMYASGLGVNVDTDKAIFWLEKAEKIMRERAEAANQVISSDCE